jgi:hypothetical protein
MIATLQKNIDENIYEKSQEINWTNSLHSKVIIML